jgi:hypothetical protein
MFDVMAYAPVGKITIVESTQESEEPAGCEWDQKPRLFDELTHSLRWERSSSENAG